MLERSGGVLYNYLKVVDKEMYQKHKCMPHVKIVAGVVLFLLSWFLEAEAVKTLWMVLTGVLTIVGIVFLVKMKATCKVGKKK